MSILEFLEQWLSEETPHIGQLVLRRFAQGVRIHHQDDDPELDTLTIYTTAHQAREIAKADAAGNFRPLKSAPNLQRGWLLELTTTDQVRLALDHFYPAAVANWLHFHQRQNPSRIVPLRETLSRQTGMYRITSTISDQQAQTQVATTCADNHCARRILWLLASDIPLTELPPAKYDPSAPSNTIPLVCCEGCNFLVAAIRTAIKSKQPGASD